MEKFTLQAMAKINLGLDVVRRLENGYHEVKMIMQTVALYDELTFEAAEEGICLRTDRDTLPADESNLVWKAAKLIMEQYGIAGGVKIDLKKKIPMAAGLAGGSSDAAAVFHGMNRLFSLGMDVEEMKRLAVRIGADVPFCIVGGTMRSEGIGEILTPLPQMQGAHLVIARPDVLVSTRSVFEKLHVERITRHPDMDRTEAAMRSGDLYGMCYYMENILETVTKKAYPVIGQIEADLKACGALAALMSGSGPSVFGIFETQTQATAACRTLREAGVAREIFPATFIDRGCREKDSSIGGGEGL